MDYLRRLPVLYYITVVVVLLSLWTRDVLGICVAAVCFVVGTVQYVRATTATTPTEP